MVVEAVDVSSYQHPNGADIDYAAAYAAGVRKAAVKLTEGVGYVNPYADADMRGFFGVGCEVVPYHFAQFNRNTAADEAAFFTRSLPEYARGWRRALDIEGEPPQTWRGLAQWITDFQRASACDLLYVNRTFQNNLSVAGLNWPGGLWIAAPSETVMPTEAEWWQYGSGGLAGFAGGVDYDQVREAAAMDTFDTVWNNGEFAKQVNQWIADQTDAAIQRACAPGGQIDAAIARHAQGGSVPTELTIVLSGTAKPA